MEVNKFEAAEQQLNVAIRLFFQTDYNIAVYTLARAAHELLEGLCMHRSLPGGVVRESLKEVKTEFHALILRRINDAKNFFKHADRDPERILTWDPTVIEYYIWDATSLHYKLNGRNSTPEIMSFRIWFRAHHEELWANQENLFEKLLPGAISEIVQIPKDAFLEQALKAYKTANG